MNGKLHRTARFLLFAGLIATLAMPMVAQAGHRSHASLIFGAAFRIGAIHFQIGFGNDHRDHYYRTSNHLRYEGARCNDRCYIDRGSYYHHSTCPVVRTHWQRYRVSPHRLVAEFGPRDRYDRRYAYEDDYGYGDGYYDDDDRRYSDRRRRSNRNDYRNPRYEHRHDANCGHDWRHRRP